MPQLSNLLRVLDTRLEALGSYETSANCLIVDTIQDLIRLESSSPSLPEIQVVFFAFFGLPFLLTKRLSDFSV